MNVTIRVRHEAGEQLFQTEAGTPVASLLREAGLLNQPCGVGKCGKCLIYANTEPCTEEKALLGQRVQSGLRLACHTLAAEGLEIVIPKPGELRVLTQFAQVDYVFSPFVRQARLSFAQPALEDQRSDVQRLLDACGASRHVLELDRLAALPALVRSGTAYALIQDGVVLDCSGSEEHYGLVVDIGTTTVAALLVDLRRGRIVAVRGERNAQASYGADVISRIRYDMEDAARPLQEAIIRQLNGLLRELLAEAGVEDVALISLTGNTTMMHFLCGLPAEHISRAPFIPLTLEAMRLPAARLGLRSRATAFLLPGISAYIGADIVASLLAADAHTEQPPFLLVDLGTNAETVLSANGTLYACSAAAGPCFEGATLSCGMAGQDGAIDTVSADRETGMTFTTLGKRPARGLCGSGVLDAMALLLDAGLVDETGRLEADESALGCRIRDDALVFVDAVRLTQKDIREIQLAKAAVRAGIDILLAEAGLQVADVACLYLAGGFGSAMNPASAARVGLIPEELAGKVRVLGNAAGFGALRYVTEQGAPEHARTIIGKTRYIELSAHAGFTEAYIERITFPEPEVFPSRG